MAANPGEHDIPTDAEHLYAIRERLAALELYGAQNRTAITGLRGDLDALSKRFEGMTKADEIAVAVTDAMDARRRVVFNIPRKLLAGFAGLVLAVPAVHDALSWWFGL